MKFRGALAMDSPLTLKQRRGVRTMEEVSINAIEQAEAAGV